LLGFITEGLRTNNVMEDFTTEIDSYGAQRVSLDIIQGPEIIVIFIDFFSHIFQNS